MKRVSTNKLFLFLTLFSSAGTLICCALPALLVSLGMGAVLAGLASNVPALIWVSENKMSVFLLAAFLLTLNGILIWKNRFAPCPIDPQLREACLTGRKFSRQIYGISLAVFACGFFFAFLAPMMT